MADWLFVKKEIEVWHLIWLIVSCIAFGHFRGNKFLGR